MTRDDISSLAHFKWNCYIIIQPLISFGKMTIITKKVTFVTSSLYHIMAESALEYRPLVFLNELPDLCKDSQYAVTRKNDHSSSE